MNEQTLQKMNYVTILGCITDLENRCKVLERENKNLRDIAANSVSYSVVREPEIITMSPCRNVTLPLTCEVGIVDEILGFHVMTKWHTKDSGILNFGYYASRHENTPRHIAEMQRITLREFERYLKGTNE